MPLLDMIASLLPSEAVILSWLLTYLLHSSLIIGLVWSLSLILRNQAMNLQDMLWKLTR